MVISTQYISKSEQLHGLCDCLADRSEIPTVFLKQTFAKIFDNPMPTLTNDSLSCDIAKRVSTSTVAKTGWIYCPAVVKYLPPSFRQTVEIMNSTTTEYILLYNEITEYKISLVCDQYLISDISQILRDYVDDLANNMNNKMLSS
jgi:hypothetical protein